MPVEKNLERSHPGEEVQIIGWGLKIKSTKQFVINVTRVAVQLVADELAGPVDNLTL